MRYHLATLPISFSLSLLFPNSSVLAQSVFASQVQGTHGSSVKLTVSPGHGLNINFIPTGEIIRKAWLDDPSQIALSFDGDLCEWSDNQEQQCTNAGASVIHLRKIEPIKFPNLPRSTDGSTLLTVITHGAAGSKLYQFQIEPASASSKPQYTALNIKPDSENHTLVGTQPISTTNSGIAGLKKSETFENPTISSLSQTVQLAKEELAIAEETHGNNSQFLSKITPAINTPTITNQFSDESPQTNHSQRLIDEVNAAPSLVLGLLVARQRGEISPNTLEWLKVQTAHSWLRRGTTIEEAANRAEMPLFTLNQLIKWGQEGS